jgi:hypothetical protein
MKTKFIIFLLVVISALSITAQNSNLNAVNQTSKSGVYLTYSDFKNNKLTYEVDCKKETNAIKLHEFLNKSFITVKYKGNKIDLQKDSIYGIQNCDEPLIRFQNKEHFVLAEKGPLWIFYKEVNVAQSKGTKFEKEYFFSSTGGGKLIELTINNVKSTFPDNHKLHDAIDLQFQNISISEYDTFHKMFKINHIITDSKNDSVCPMHSDIKGKEGDNCQKCGKKLEKL